MPKIIFDFSGGCMDGKTVCSDSPDPREAKEARDFYTITEDGAEGRGFWTFSPAGLETIDTEGAEIASGSGFRANHLYRITDRLAEGDEVLIRAQFEPGTIRPDLAKP